MKTRLISYALTASLFALSSAAVAQTYTDTNANPAPEGGVIIPGPSDVLWDNTQIAASTAGIVSTRALGLPVGAQEAQTADDFTVPGGVMWTVEFVYSEGFVSAGSPSADSFAVIFYEDDGGQPGAVVAEESIVAGGPVTDATQELTLASPVQLSAGTYWVSIVGEFQGSTALATGRWNWTTGPTGIDNEWHLQDTAGFFGAPLPWTPASGLAIADISAFFALRGTSANALPESVPVPTLSQWSLILLVLVLAGVAGTVLIRRA